MGCNCGGKKTKSGPGIAGSSQPTPAPAPPASNTGVTQQFSLTTGSRVQKFGSMLEAKAANVRQGGTGTVSPA